MLVTPKRCAIRLRTFGDTFIARRFDFRRFPEAIITFRPDDPNGASSKSYDTLSYGTEHEPSHTASSVASNDEQIRFEIRCHLNELFGGVA